MAATSELVMSFPGGRKVAARIGRHNVLTDQPVEVGGEDAAPSPFSLFLVSIGACAGFFALTFLQKRNLPTEGLEVRAIPHNGEDGVLANVEIEVKVPSSFPEKYREALVRTIEQCSVKRAIAAQPAFNVKIHGTAAEAPAASSH